MATRQKLSAKIFECTSCETTHHSARGVVPVGWSTCRGNAWCVDCTRAGIAAREARYAA